MSTTQSRRAFLSQLGASGALLAAGPWLRSIGYAQIARGPARAVILQSRARAEFDRRLFGAFLEHLGRAIYTGVYEPGSALADANGFRTDVITEIKGLGVPVMRYPGRQFRLGLQLAGRRRPEGPAARPCWSGPGTRSRPTSSAPTSSSTGAKPVGTEPLLGFNLGTGTPEMAVAYVEYCNVAKGTKWSDLRRSHGYEQPHKVKYWCLGNEMDGPWQMGRLTAREYGRKARDTARQIRVIDRDVQLIACGSSNTILPTYLVWDREVLEECYDQVDGISLHNYYGNTPQLTGNNSARFLAMNLDMERQIHEIAAVADYVQGLRKSPKRLWLSFDEWNVWYRARERRLHRRQGRVRAAPARGGLQPRGCAARRRFSQHAAAAVRARARRVPGADRERHRAARDQRDGVLRQTIYYPYAWALQYARGRVLDLLVESETYPIAAAGLRADFARDDQVPFLDVVATLDPRTASVRADAQPRPRVGARAGPRLARPRRRPACWPARP